MKLKKFKITAKSVGYLENIIEAPSFEQAEIKMQDMLDNGEMTRIGEGSIENEKIEELAEN